MTRNDYITEPFPLCRGEHGVQDMNRPPVGEEVSLLVACRGILTKIEIAINITSEFEVCAYATRGPCRFQEIFWNLAFAELCAQRGEETAGL